MDTLMQPQLGYSTRNKPPPTSIEDDGQELLVLPYIKGLGDADQR